MTHIVRYWDAVVSLLLAIAAALLLEGAIIEKVTPEMISFYAIQSAVILLAMIFTAGILRADALSEAEAIQYQLALRRQMQFWVTLLGCDFLVVILLIAGKATGWCFDFRVWGYNVKMTPTIIGVTSAAVLVSLFRIIPFVKGVMSLLDLNGLLILKSIRARNNVAAKNSVPHVPFVAPDEFGKIR